MPAHFFQLGLEFVPQPEQFRTFVRQQLAGFGQGAATGGPLQQGDAQLLFQPAEFFGQGRFAQVQVPGGVGDALVLLQGLCQFDGLKSKCSHDDASRIPICYGLLPV